MTKTKKLLTLLVILAMAAVSTVSLGAAEKQAAGGADKLININTADAICIGDWWVKTHRKDLRYGRCG